MEANNEERTTSEIRVNDPAGRVYWLDVARVLAIISISLNHAVNRSYDNYTDQMGDFLSSNLFSTLIKTVVTVFSHLGVPLFLMISGALLLEKHINDESGVKRFYRHNLLGLVITSEIWYFLMFWFRVFVVPGQPLLKENTLPQLLWRMVKTMLLVDQITFDSTWYIAMVIPLYLLIPFIVILRWRVSPRTAVWPLALLALVYTMIPSVNELLFLGGNSYQIGFSLIELNVFRGSMTGYILYVCLGHWISRGGLKKLSTLLTAVFCAAAFFGTCAVQYYGYSQPQNYLASYHFIGIVLCGLFTFELIRRGARLVEGVSRPVTYLSQIAFGIYFVHILIMSAMRWYLDFSAWPRYLQLVCYEAVSFGGSVIIIALLSRIPVLKKYMFMIKDGKNDRK